MINMGLHFWKDDGGGGGGSYSGPYINQSVSNSTTGNDCGLVMNIPFTAVTTGNLLLVCIANNIEDIALPSGFTAELSSPERRCQVFWKISNGTEYSGGGSEIGIVYNGTSPLHGMSIIGIEVANVTGATPIDAWSAATSTNISPIINANFGQELILSIGGSNTVSTNFTTQPMGFTLVERISTGAPAQTALAVASKERISSGSEPAASWDTGTYTGAKVFSISIY